MRITQVSPADIGGGAEKVALNLHEAYLKNELLDPTLAAARFLSQVPNSYLIDNEGKRGFLSRGAQALAPKLKGAHEKLSGLEIATRRALISIANPKRALRVLSGKIDVDFPASYSIATDTQAEILHLHNMHGGYFDIRALPHISATQPSVFTAHDTWMNSGHCAYSVYCENWINGAECKPCPHLNYPPAIQKDNAHYNYQLKKAIFASMPERLHVVAPSAWGIRELERGILAPAIASARVIPNGINQDIFTPVDADEKLVLRAKLGIERDAFCLIFSLASANNPYKDLKTLNQALGYVARESNQEICFIVLGGHDEFTREGKLTRLGVPFKSDPHEVASYFQASDLYLHAALAEAQGLVILEAMSCGIPVVVSNTGGSPESVLEGETGLIFKQEDARELANATLSIINDPARYAEMSKACLAHAHPRFSIERMASDYLSLYESLL